MVNGLVETIKLSILTHFLSYNVFGTLEDRYHCIFFFIKGKLKHDRFFVIFPQHGSLTWKSWPNFFKLQFTSTVAIESQRYTYSSGIEVELFKTKLNHLPGFSLISMWFVF